MSLLCWFWHTPSKEGYKLPLHDFSEYEVGLSAKATGVFCPCKRCGVLVQTSRIERVR